MEKSGEDEDVLNASVSKRRPTESSPSRNDQLGTVGVNAEPPFCGVDLIGLHAIRQQQNRDQLLKSQLELKRRPTSQLSKGENGAQGRRRDDNANHSPKSTKRIPNTRVNRRLN